MKMITYKGPGTHYLVFNRESNMHFMVPRKDRVAISDELYDLLLKAGHIGEGKLELYELPKTRPYTRAVA